MLCAHEGQVVEPHARPQPLQLPLSVAVLTQVPLQFVPVVQTHDDPTHV
jgi:hypothetical protein